MAVTQNTLIGAARGRVGNAVFSTWKGLNTLREKPASVANPNTEPQQAQRSVLRQLVAIFRLIPTAFDQGFKQFNQAMSPYNAFVKYNAPESFSISGAVATFVAAQFKAAKGSLGALVDFAKTLDTGRTYDLTWTNNSGASNANSSDVLEVVVISADGLNCAHISTGAPRSAGAESVAIPGSWSLTGARFVAYFMKADGSMASDSVNIAV